MAGPEDFFKLNVLAGIAVGVGAVVLAPVVLPVVAALARPLAKSTMKAGVIMFEKGREAAAEMAEVFEDLVAEARAELDMSGEEASAAVMSGAASEPLRPANGQTSSEKLHERQ